MSLMNSILNQKLILISLGLATLMIFAAAGLTIRSRIVHNSRKRAQLKAKQSRQTTLAAENSAEVATSASSPAVSAVPAPPVVTAAASNGTNVPINKPTGVTTVASGTTRSTDSSATAGQPDISDAMKDMLSTVFIDEDALARKQVLLHGLEPIDIHRLAAQSVTVAMKLHTSGSALRKESK